MDASGQTIVNDERLNQTEEADIERTFAYHKPSDDGLAQITKLRRAYSDLKRLVESTCPPSRERSVALTELETSGMWAIKAVVINDPKSEPEGMNQN